MIKECDCGESQVSVIPYGLASHQVKCRTCGNRGIPGDTPTEAISLWNDPKFTHDVFGTFPYGVTLKISKPFDGDRYYVGYSCGDMTYSPGTPSYYSFDEAVERCYRAYRDRFELPKVREQVTVWQEETQSK